MFPDIPDTLLTRDQTAVALTGAGYPVKAKTLATKASRGGGPPYRLFGTKPLYRWGEALAWAEARTSTPRSSTSEGDTARPTTSDRGGGRGLQPRLPAMIRDRQGAQ